MSLAILHIGLPKTGTTAIQRALSTNRDRLAAHGVSYPEFLNGENHLELGAYALADDTPWSTHVRRRQGAPAEFDRRIEEGVGDAAGRGGDWVFTSEHLASRVHSDEAHRRLHDLMSVFDGVKILMYVRPQDEMAVASHSTWVRDGRDVVFDVDAHMKMHRRYDFSLVARRWAEFYGESDIEIRLYDPVALIDDFARAIGSTGDGWEPPPRANASMDSTALAFMECVNRSLDADDQLSAPKMADVAARQRLGERLRMSSADRRRFLAHFRDCNEWIMQRAVDAAVHPDYFDPPNDDAPGTMHHVLTADEAVRYAIALWASPRAGRAAVQRQR